MILFCKINTDNKKPLTLFVRMSGLNEKSEVSY